MEIRNLHFHASHKNGNVPMALSENASNAIGQLAVELKSLFEEVREIHVRTLHRE